MRPHRACNFSIRPVSRGDGRSSVAAAAYRAGGRFYDERVGRVRNYRWKRDVVSVEMVGWQGDPETMWNLVEASERRVNSRVARDIVTSLPVELPLDTQVKLARGYALWLRDRYGTPSMVAIHAPVGHPANPYRQADEETLEDLRPQFRKKTKPKGDPRNHHVHILTTTRVWDVEARRFGKKVRELDDRKQGPMEVQACRDEWQKRVNAALQKHGVDARVDLRSYEKMVAAGDAPACLTPQPKRSPGSVGRSRRLQHEQGEDNSAGGLRQRKIRDHNDASWEAWEMLRHLARQKARNDGTSAEIAARREAARRAKAEPARRENAPASNRDAGMAVAEGDPSPEPADVVDPLRRAILDAECGSDAEPETGDEFSQTIDPETFESPDTKVAPRYNMRVRVHEREPVRKRWG